MSEERVGGHVPKKMEESDNAVGDEAVQDVEMKWHELSQWRSEMAAVHKVHLELHVGKNTEPSSTGLIIHLPRSIAAHPNDPLDESDHAAGTTTRSSTRKTTDDSVDATFASTPDTVVSEATSAVNPEDFECALCHELLYRPTTLRCQHSFCCDCLADMLQRATGVTSRQCPLCRSPMHVACSADLSPSPEFSKLLEACFPEETARRREQCAAAAAIATSAVITGEAAGAGGAPLASNLGVFILEPLLPGQKMRLHVFEPRYRALVRHALDGSRSFGMGYETRSSTFRCCECSIEESQELPGGRYNVTIVGRHVFEAPGSDVLVGNDGFLVARGSRLVLDASDDAEQQDAAVYRQTEVVGEDVDTGREEEVTEGERTEATSSTTEEISGAEGAPAVIEASEAPAHENSSEGSDGPEFRQSGNSAANTENGGTRPEERDENNLPLETMASDLVVKLAHWKRLVHEGGYEQFPRHLAEVETELGPMPLPSHPSRLALWAAALINPLPGLGVAPEIRPIILRCDTARRRLKVATAGVNASIKSLTALQNSWWRRILRMILTQVDHRAWVGMLICIVALCADRVLSPSTSVAPTAEGTPEEESTQLPFE